MLFASPRLLQFFQDELGYPEELINQIREDFFEMFFLILEAEINNYLDKHNLEEEYKRLEKIQKNDNLMGTDITQAFLDLYMDNPEIMDSVNEKMGFFTQMFMSNLQNHMSKDQMAEMNRLIDLDIQKYQKAQEQLTPEI